MSHFEYIMVMVSIIQGLGITLALRGISRLIRSPRREPVVLLWAIFMVLLYLQNWWAFWDMSAVEDWNLIKFLFLAVYVCTLYAMTELMLPIASTQDTDWLGHFNSIRKWFFGMLIVLVVLGITLNWYISDIPLVHPYRITQLAVLFLGAIGWATPNMAAQRWVVVLLYLVLFGGQMVFRLLPGLSV